MGETAAMLLLSPAEGRMFSQLLICSGEEPLNQASTGTLAVWPLYRVLGGNKLFLSTCEQHENRTFHHEHL